MTGYTYRLIDNKQSFPEFVMSCARAFGALIMMREDAMDAEVPQRFEPSSYHIEELEKARAEVARLETMSESERRAYAYQRKEEAILYRISALREAKQRCETMQAMLDRVNAWEPPTEEHVGLKEFMVQQLTDSIKHEAVDWHETWLQEAKDTPTLSYYDDDLARARNSIDYHTRDHAEEVERTEGRNQWLAALRDSLKEKE